MSFAKIIRQHLMQGGFIYGAGGVFLSKNNNLFASQKG